MKKFAIIGVGGYVADKHLKAIKNTGNILFAAHDIIDSVGLLDSYFRDCLFTTNIDEFTEMLHECDYLVIATPNYLHFEHIQLGLFNGCDVICEKPLVLHSVQLDCIKSIEKKTGHTCYTILQLRKQRNVISTRDKYLYTNEVIDISLKYITTRGDWYLKSWKGSIDHSGGLEANIGIHLFDALIWMFGNCSEIEITHKEQKTTKGIMHLEKARVNFHLSFDYNELCQKIKDQNGYAQRELIVDGNSIDISEGFTDLHTELYREILNGNGYRADETRKAIIITELIRNQYRIL